jgi:hypothetical protein
MTMTSFFASWAKATVNPTPAIRATSAIRRLLMVVSPEALRDTVQTEANPTGELAPNGFSGSNG